MLTAFWLRRCVSTQPRASPCCGHPGYRQPLAADLHRNTDDALLKRVACTRRPKALNAALLATRSVDVLPARAAGNQWPQTCIATRKVDALRTRAILASLALSSGLVLEGRDRLANRVLLLDAVTRATGNQWPQTCLATRKVDALLNRVACTR